MKAQEFIDNMTARGETSFTAEAMRRELKNSTKAIERAIYRLKHRKQIVGIAKGFYLILTPEFREMGCLPPDYFIDDLMRHWEQDYYVGLLSAALYYGAAHQQPQVFQVVIDHFRPAMQCGRVKIEFVTKKIISKTPCNKIKTKTGMMSISSPESTLIDLIVFLRRSGGLNHVATVIDELVDSVDRNRLQKLLETSTEQTWVQRLGFLLEHLGHTELSNIFYDKISPQNTNIVPLVPYRSMVGAERDFKWRVAVNAVMESDLGDSD